MQLFHRGKDLVLGTQIYLTDELHSLSFEEKLTELGKGSSRLARAMGMDRNEGYSLPVQFSNPAAAKSNNLQGAGLRVSKAGQQSLSAYVVAHNASQNEITVNGRVPYTTNDGSTGELYIPQIHLSAGEPRSREARKLRP